jgi:hypothetical protein
MEPLITISNSADLETQRCIAYALCNLASNEDNRRSLVTEGGLPPIISLACSEDHADKLCAISTLRGIASDPDTRIKIVEEGGLEPLALGARVNNVEVHRESARCAASLALNEGNKVIMSDHEVLPDIVRLAQSTDAETARYACGTLANLAENFETHEGIIEVAGLLFLSKLAGGAAIDNDVELQREGCRCLANLCANFASQPAVFDVGGHVALIGACSMEDVLVRRFGTLGVVNMSIQPGCHEELLKNSAVAALVDLVSMEIDDDHECQRYACLALGNLASSVDNHPAILGGGALAPLCDALTAEDLETRFYAAFALGKLAQAQHNHARIGRAGCLPALIALARSEDNHAKCQSICTIRRLAMHADNRVAAVEQGVLVPLAIAGRSTDVEIQREVAACVCNLALSDENKLLIAQSDVLTPLVSLAQSPDIEVSRQACGALANIAEDVEAHPNMVYEQSMHFLVFLLRSR